MLSPNSEPATVRSSEKELAFLRTSNLPNQGWAQFFLRTRALPRFGERNWPFSELRTCRNRVRPSSFTELRTCQDSESEKGAGLSPNSEPAEPELYPFFLRTPNLPNQGYTRSFSELQTETPNSGQKHNPGPSGFFHASAPCLLFQTAVTCLLFQRC